VAEWKEAWKGIWNMARWSQIRRNVRKW